MIESVMYIGIGFLIAGLLVIGVLPLVHGRAVRLTGRIGDAVQFFYAHTEQCWYEMAAVFFRGTFEGAPLGAGSDELSWLDPAREADSLFHACHAWAVGQAP